MNAKLTKAHCLNSIKQKTFTTLAVLIISSASIAHGFQVLDGDDQFQVLHQDIGRISGGATGSANQAPVAPQTTIVRQQQQIAPANSIQLQAPLAPAAFQVPAEHPRANLAQRQRGHNNNNNHHHAQAPTRKPNRITLAVRTSAPIQASFPEPTLSAVEQPVKVEPRLELPSTSSFTSSQLIAPPALQHQQQQQPSHHNHHHHQELPTPQFQPLFSPAADHQAAQPAQPALSSFQSSLGHANSVSARHNALIAQVAAERAAASPAPLQTEFPQPSLGSPIEALSAPTAAQVQPPPTVSRHTHHHHTNQQVAAAHPVLNFVNQLEEPIVAPSFEHVLGHGCPKVGVFSYDNKDHCDRYYMCTNGTFTEEACPNGLAYSQMGAVYQHCAYNWNVDCGNKKTSGPLASPGCPWQFGIFPIQQAGQCSIDYFVCEWGVPETKRCSPEGLFYDDRIKGCQWADQLGCKSEALLNFKCPPEDEDNPYWPYPRYYHTKQDIIVCVNEQPRLVHCNEDQLVDPASLACIDLKKKKKF